MLGVGNEGFIVGGSCSIDSFWYIVVVKLLKFLLVMMWVGILVEENVLVGIFVLLEIVILSI